MNQKLVANGFIEMQYRYLLISNDIPVLAVFFDLNKTLAFKLSLILSTSIVIFELDLTIHHKTSIWQVNGTAWYS